MYLKAHALNNFFFDDHHVMIAFYQLHFENDEVWEVCTRREKMAYWCAWWELLFAKVITRWRLRWGFALFLHKYLWNWWDFQFDSNAQNLHRE
jgi:hypothetical protein